MTHQAYEHKELSYFSAARTDIRQLLPDRFGRVLEVGCGSGATLGWLKTLRPNVTTIGIELVPEQAELARPTVDHILCQDTEATDLPDVVQEVDLILCLDVLEHFVDPLAVLTRLRDRMTPGGVLIASIPNVRFWRASFPLIFQGRWEYGSSGVLDETHLRFFTKTSATQLVQRCGLLVDAVQPRLYSKAALANRLSLGLLEEWLAERYLVRGHL